MSALPRPDVTGPARTLNDALHDLHHRAGWPSLRTLAREAGVSHTTVSKVFSSPAVPAWGILELVVDALGGDPRAFRDLWLAASTGASPVRPVPPVRIAGRRDELAAVHGHLDAGHGLLLVTGEAGIGKSTVVAAAATTLSTPVVTGHCFPLSAATPFMPLVEVMRGLHDLDGGRPLAAALAAAPAFVADEVALLLPDLGSRSAIGGPAEWARQRLVSAVQSLLAAWADLGRVAVVLEDLHWADASTLDLLEHLGARPPATPIVATWRLDDPSTDPVNTSWFARLRSRSQVAEVTLGPMTREETAAQLALQSADVDADSVFARSRGHPLFTAQLAAHGSDAELPGVLADLLDSRLGELDGTAWRLVRALGVAGRPLDLDLLASSSGVELPAAVAGLGALAGRRLLDRDPDRASLAHPLLNEAVRRRLLPGEGRAQHRALAEALARGTDPDPGEVAAHWMSAGDGQQEAEWRVRAAGAAARRLDRAQEAEQWLRVLAVRPSAQGGRAPIPVTRATAYFAAMDALDASLQFDRAAELCAAAESELGLDDDAVAAELLRRAAVHRGQREGVLVTASLLDRALELYTHLPVCEGLVWALDWKQNLLRDEGDHGGSYEVARAAVDAASKVGDAPLLRRSMARLAWHVGVRDGVEAAQRYLDRADRVVAPGSDPLGDIRRAVIETDVMLICGARADDVLAAGAPGMLVANSLGVENFDVLLIAFNGACALLRAGRVAQVARLRAAPTGPVDLDRWPEEFVRLLVSGLRGDLARASEGIERLWRDMGGHWDRDLEIMVLAETVHAWCPASRPRLDRLLRAIEVSSASTPPRLLAPGLLAATRLAADLASTGDEDASILRRLGEASERTGLSAVTIDADSFLAAHRATWSAEAARVAGKDSADDWARAARGWDPLERPHEAAYCRWRAARCALRDRQGTLAARLLRKATADAREHVPLSDAIATTAAGAR